MLKLCKCMQVNKSYRLKKKQKECLQKIYIFKKINLKNMIFTFWLCMKPIILYMPFGPSKKKIKLLAYMYTITNRSPHNLQVFWKKKLRVNEPL